MPSGTAQPFRFTGHERDLLDTADARDDSENHHALRFSLLTARYQSPDPIRGDIFAPQSFNLFAYVGGNPMNLTDPFGLFGGVITVVKKDPCSAPLEPECALEKVVINEDPRENKDRERKKTREDKLCDAIRRVGEALFPVNIQATIPLLPLGLTGLFGGLDVSGTFNKDGSIDLYIGGGLVALASARAIRPGQSERTDVSVSGSWLERTLTGTGPAPSGWGTARFSAAAHTPFLVGANASLITNGSRTDAQFSPSLGVGMSAAFTVGWSGTIRDAPPVSPYGLCE